MTISHRSFYFLLLMGLAFIVTSCGKPQSIPRVAGTVGNITSVDDASMESVVYQFPGYGVVHFYNDKFWQSKDMANRMSFLADRYSTKVRFCEFNWDVTKSGKKYGLTMLPTVVLYHNGQEIDRIKGIPDKKEDRESWNNDLNLWLLKNTMEAEGDMHSGSYVYRFKNTSELQISSF